MTRVAALQAKGEPAWQRIALVGAVGAVALLGNMRASGSLPGESAAPSSQVVPRSPPVDATRAEGESHGNRADGRDDGRLIPAIYAWDPDVRFIYYRHLSKWM